MNRTIGTAIIALALGLGAPAIRAGKQHGQPASRGP